MNQHRIVPFYMAYSMPYVVEEDTAARDLEYLQQMFPEQSRRYARKIASVVDRLDYKGSMIYDEYPDRLRIYALSQDIVKMIRQEEAEADALNQTRRMNQTNGAGQMNGTMPTNGLGQTNEATQTNGMNQTDTMPQNNGINQMNGTGLQNGNTAGMDDSCLSELIYVLLCYEIYKRRHGNNNPIWVL